MEGKTSAEARVSRTMMGGAAGCKIVTDWAIESAALTPGTSVIEPWQFKMELKQQSGSDEEDGGAGPGLLGQQA